MFSGSVVWRKWILCATSWTLSTVLVGPVRARAHTVRTVRYVSYRYVARKGEKNMICFKLRAGCSEVHLQFGRRCPTVWSGSADFRFLKKQVPKTEGLRNCSSGRLRRNECESTRRWGRATRSRLPTSRWCRYMEARTCQGHRDTQFINRVSKKWLCFYTTHPSKDT
jgi:hypothetical protein